MVDRWCCSQTLQQLMESENFAAVAKSSRPGSRDRSARRQRSRALGGRTYSACMTTRPARLPHAGSPGPAPEAGFRRGPEPSCILGSRDEWRCSPTIRWRNASPAKLADECLAASCGGTHHLKWRASDAARPIRVHGHCHQSVRHVDATLALLRAVPGAQVQAIESSCCGMAGRSVTHYDVDEDGGKRHCCPRRGG
jgi:hypothetical protein